MTIFFFTNHILHFFLFLFQQCLLPSRYVPSMDVSSEKQLIRSRPIVRRIPARISFVKRQPRDYRTTAPGMEDLDGRLPQRHQLHPCCDPPVPVTKSRRKTTSPWSVMLIYVQSLVARKRRRPSNARIFVPITPVTIHRARTSRWMIIPDSAISTSVTAPTVLMNAPPLCGPGPLIVFIIPVTSAIWNSRFSVPVCSSSAQIVVSDVPSPVAIILPRTTILVIVPIINASIRNVIHR